MEHIEEFNLLIKTLIVKLYRYDTNDVVINQIKNRILLLIDSAPLKPIEIVGPIIYQYRDHLPLIKNKDIEGIKQLNLFSEEREQYENGYCYDKCMFFIEDTAEINTICDYINSMIACYELHTA